MKALFSFVFLFLFSFGAFASKSDDPATVEFRLISKTKKNFRISASVVISERASKAQWTVRNGKKIIKTAEIKGPLHEGELRTVSFEVSTLHRRSLNIIFDLRLDQNGKQMNRSFVVPLNY